METTASAASFEMQRSCFEDQSTSSPCLDLRKCGTLMIPPLAMPVSARRISIGDTASACPNDMAARLAPSYWSRSLMMPVDSPEKSTPVAVPSW